jgi:hypothetical protein
MQRLRSRLTYANVTATLALIIAVAGGTAIASSKIGAQDLKKIKVRQAQADQPTTGFPVAVARCHSGEKVVGGGGIASNLGATNPQGNGWAAGGAIGDHVIAYALCLTR